MPPLEKLSDLELRKRLLDVERALADESTLFAEYKLIQRLLDSRELGGRPVYSGVMSVIDAIELCWEIKDSPMTRQELFEELTLGGFPLQPNTGRRLITNTLTYYVGTGRVARHGEKFGKPIWPKSKFVS